MAKKIKNILISVLLLVILFFIMCPIVNDISAKKVMNDISSIPLPENTQIVEKFSQAGKLTGNGNGMQFIGAVLVKSNLSLEEMDKYYSAYRETEWDCIVKQQETKEIDIIEHGSFSFQTDVSNGHYYVIYSWGEGIFPFRDFDLRGN